MTSLNKIVVGQYAIVWNDGWHRIEVNGRKLNLSPTQYRLCHAFLAVPPAAPVSGVPGEIFILSYQSYEELQDATELPSRQLLTKHISRLNARIAGIGFHICPFRRGYIFTAFSPMLSRRNE